MPPPASARQPESHDGGWFATPLAQKLLRREQHEAIPRLTSIYGHTGLYLRCMVDAPAELSGNMLHRLLRLHRDDARLEGDVCCVEHDLPLLRESVDLVYLLHAFEQSPQPQSLLLELERVLGAGGQPVHRRAQSLVAVALALERVGIARDIGCAAAKPAR
jgi:hypothetical protein